MAALAADEDQDWDALGGGGPSPGAGPGGGGIPRGKRSARSGGWTGGGAAASGFGGGFGSGGVSATPSNGSGSGDLLDDTGAGTFLFAVHDPLMARRQTALVAPCRSACNCTETTRSPGFRTQCVKREDAAGSAL